MYINYIIIFNFQIYYFKNKKMRQSRAHDCQIKDILYPEKPKPTKNFLSSNFKRIKIIQEQNRQKNLLKSQYTERKFLIKIIFQ